MKNCEVGKTWNIFRLQVLWLPIQNIIMINNSFYLQMHIVSGFPCLAVDVCIPFVGFLLLSVNVLIKKQMQELTILLKFNVP